MCFVCGAGGEAARAIIMEAGVVPHLTPLLHHQKSSVCTMALWVIINLCTGYGRAWKSAYLDKMLSLHCQHGVDIL